MREGTRLPSRPRTRAPAAEARASASASEAGAGPLIMVRRRDSLSRVDGRKDDGTLRTVGERLDGCVRCRLSFDAATPGTAMVHQPYSAETLEWLNDSGRASSCCSSRTRATRSRTCSSRPARRTTSTRRSARRSHPRRRPDGTRGGVSGGCGSGDVVLRARAQLPRCSAVVPRGRAEPQCPVAWEAAARRRRRPRSQDPSCQAIEHRASGRDTRETIH
jgi:hypothetical protein